jgi:hypothetical protein
MSIYKGPSTFDDKPAEKETSFDTPVWGGPSTYEDKPKTDNDGNDEGHVYGGISEW